MPSIFFDFSFLLSRILHNKQETVNHLCEMELFEMMKHLF